MSSIRGKLRDAETEATETRVWVQFAVAYNYLSSAVCKEIRLGYDNVIGKLVNMLTHPDDWVLRSREEE